MQLLGTLRIGISKLLAERLLAIDNHDFSGVKRKVREEKRKYGIQVTDEWLDAGVYALKQYYTLILVDGRNMHAISDVTDPFWHEHMLHSEQYMAFCDQVFGRYLHHHPIDQAKKLEVEFVDRVYAYTLERTKECFSVFDRRFHTERPPRDQHICAHKTDVTDGFAMFPVVPEAQPPAMH